MFGDPVLVGLDKGIDFAAGGRQRGRTTTRQSRVISSASVLRRERISSYVSMVPTLAWILRKYKGGSVNDPRGALMRPADRWIMEEESGRRRQD